MKKIKVNELANELNITSKELMKSIDELGIKALSHTSSLGEKEANLLRELIK